MNTAPHQDDAMDPKLLRLSQLPQPGQKLSGTDIIFIKVHEPISRTGERLGRALAFFAAPENLPQTVVRTFDEGVAAIGALTDWHGCSGWKIGITSSYEDRRFHALRDGSAIGKWVMPELELVNGSNRNDTRPSGLDHMLALSTDQTSPLYHSIAINPDPTKMEFLLSCTEPPHEMDALVATAPFSVGSVNWSWNSSVNWVSKKDGGSPFSCVRPVVALDLNHLTL